MSQLEQIKNFCRLSALCGASEALRAARTAGVFTALEGPPKTAPELAEQTGIEPARLEVLLDVLVTTGAVERYGDDFAISTAMRLINNHPDVLHGPHWESLPGFLHPSSPAPQPSSPEARHAFRGDQLSMQWTLTAAAMELAEHLQIGQERTGLRILDLGAGSAMWSCAIAYRDPTSEVVAVDFPDALEAAERTSNEIGIGSRMMLIPENYQTVEFPAESFDLALVVNLLDLEPLAEAEQWLRRLRDAVKVGGEVVIVGRFPGQPRGDLHRTLTSLELAIRVPDAQSHSPTDIRHCLDRLGFSSAEPKMLDVPPYSMGAIVAKRESASGS